MPEDIANDLSPVELQLMNCVLNGEPLDLSEGADISHEEMQNWGTGRIIRSSVIRHMVGGTFPWPSDGMPDHTGVRLRGARLDSQLYLVDIESQIPLVLLDCYVPEMVNMVRASFPMVLLTGIHTKRINASYARITSQLGLSKCRARSVELRGAVIGGAIDLSNISLENPDGLALEASRLKGADDLHISGDLRSKGATISLVGAEIDGTLRVAGSIHSSDSSGFFGQQLACRGYLKLCAGLQMHGHTQFGAISLVGADVGRQLILDDIHVCNEIGPAMAADGLKVGSDLWLSRSEMIGAHRLGALRLVGASVTGMFNMSGSRLINSNGPALAARQLHVAGDVELGNGFIARGAEGQPVVGLDAVHIEGNLSLVGGKARGADAGCLDLDNAHIEGALSLPAGFACSSLDESQLDPDSWIPDGKMSLDGLTYKNAPHGATAAEWIVMLRYRTTTYAAQPYLQLAGSYSATGREHDMRAVRIAQQDDLLRRGELDRARWVWQQVLRFTLRYGYRPALALLWLCAITLFLLVIICIAARYGIVVHAKTSISCSGLDRIGFVMNRSIPVVVIDGQNDCKLSMTHRLSLYFAIATWVVRALGWVFASLFVVGLTGVVRKTN